MGLGLTHDEKLNFCQGLATHTRFLQSKRAQTNATIPHVILIF